MLDGDEHPGNLQRLFVVVFVAGGVIGIEHQVTHGRGAGRLDPDHRAVGGFEFSPLAAAVGQVVPYEGSLVADAVHHEGCGAAHRFLGLLDVEVTVRKVFERGRSLAATEDARQNGLELIERVVVIA